MSRHATDIQECVRALPLPADHVLSSGAVLFPGAFDQHGCPLIVFPVDGQAKLSSDVSKAEVVDFVNYFLCLHNKKQEKDSLVSVVADLRNASLTASRFIAETLLLLELHKRTVHTVYMIQPKKKDVVKLLLKLLAPSKTCTASFKKVLLKEVSELSSHIDRSQLTASLGGYLIYCHQSWVAFIKEIDVFVQEFLSVVQRLPACISTLQALSRQPLPASFTELRDFCSTNEARFLQLRRELGLDELLRHCELVVEKLRYPEKEPCYQAMAGTALFTHTTFDMLQNYSRITAAVEKVELLWQQAFSKARMQLQVFQLREEALQITEQIETLLKEKLQPYRLEIAKDAAKAEMSASEFEASVYTPAMALVRCAEDVIHTLVEILPFGDGQTRERWVLDLERLKEKLHSAVKLPYQTLRAVCSYYHHYSKADRWYSLVLCENFLQELLSGVHSGSVPRQRHRRSGGTIPVWRQKLSAFLKRNPAPDMEELVHLAHLSNVIPDSRVQQAGKQLSERCMTLRKLLSCPGVVAVGDLQLALQWQYDLFRSLHENQPHADQGTSRPTENAQDSLDGCHPSTNSHARSEHRLKDDIHCRNSVSEITKWETGKEVTHQQAVLGASPSIAVCGTVLAEGKPSSLSSFDSGFDGAGGSPLDAGGARDGWEGLPRLTGTRESVTPATRQPQIQEENLSCVSTSEDHRDEFDFGSVGNSSRASIHVIPRVSVDSLNFEIKNSPAQLKDPKRSGSSDIYPNADQSSRSRDQPTQTETSASVQSKGPRTRDWILHSQNSFEDPELSPIGHVLSSTITDEREKSSFATEGIPTLLWDSYDLHDQHQDACDGTSNLMDVSLKDWDLKEQEGLRQVEEMLDRADVILEEEENVLAQEAMLDVLLRSEGRENQWALWDSEDQLSAMSPSELAEAGVLGLEDCLIPAESEKLIELKTPGSPSETKVSDDNGDYSEGVTTASSAVPCSRPDLLTELRQVNILDELIMEENLKIHELRRCEENPNKEPPGNSSSEAIGPSSTSKERQVFRLQLEKEKREVERMEKSLKKELGRERKIKKHGSTTRKVVKCSIMEKATNETMGDRALCDKLLSGSRSRSQSSQHLTSTILDQFLTQDTCKTKNAYIELGLDTAKDTIPPDLGPPVDSLCQDDTDAKCNLKDLNGSGVKPTVTPQNSTSEPKDFSEEVGIQPQEFVPEKELDGQSGKDDTTCKPEASLTPEMRPDDGAFDPGGKSLFPPVPKPRTVSLPVSDNLAQHETLHSTESVNTGVPSVSQDPDLVQLDPPDAPPKPRERKNKTPADSLSLDVKEHSTNNNNNNHHLDEKCTVLSNSHIDSFEISTESKESPTLVLVSAGPPQTVLQEPILTSDPADESPNPQSPSQVPPELPVCDPGGGYELGEETSYSLQISEATRISASMLPVNQVQLTISSTITDFKTPIVLDTGSGLMKAGFADQDLPTIIFPTIIGQPKYEEIMNGDLERETYIGHDAQHMRGVLTLKHPIKNGIVRNWDEMEKIWHHTFQQLCVDPEDHPVMLTEAAMNPLENRQRMVEVMFECFNVPFTYVAMQAVLALYAAGRSTGVVFDSGDGVSHSVPVFEGYCLPHAVQRFPLAGVDVTMELKKLLQEQGVSLRTTAEMEIVREIKEKCCCVALNYEAELKHGGPSSAEMHYTMPDGQIICLSTERFRAPEILFKPELIGRDQYGMHESVFKSILGSDIDLRRGFLGNIVLSGGNTLLPGLPERLQAEIRGMVPADLVDCVRVSSPKDRDFSVWSGGAVLANLPTFAPAWISQEEYEEFGPQIVFRKCF
ncbi:uncharacterized protein LOC115356102 isoform X2 [Myripristis murdjan]|uniref:uncharacterized protein LOC115356102 isoform X2 n=1 Tax=Myripristis murdjan TaxID=586833 RepID=UPI001175E0E3|nr:uncharacterized protein LOC115356102 isoform X2 [Myripristis murdjan]